MRFTEMISYCRPELNPPHSIVKNENDIFWTISLRFSIAFVIIAMYLMYDNACPLCKIYCSIEKVKKVNHYRLSLKNCP